MEYPYIVMNSEAPSVPKIKMFTCEQGHTIVKNTDRVTFYFRVSSTSVRAEPFSVFISLESETLHVLQVSFMPL